MCRNVIVRFLDIECEVDVKPYRNNGRPCVQLVACETANNAAMGVLPGMPVATASVNVTHLLGQTDIVIKDYCENEGVLAALLNAKVVRLVGRQVFVQNVGNCQVVALCHS